MFQRQISSSGSHRNFHGRASSLGTRGGKRIEHRQRSIQLSLSLLLVPNRLSLSLPYFPLSESFSCLSSLPPFLLLSRFLSPFPAISLRVSHTYATGTRTHTQYQQLLSRREPHNTVADLVDTSSTPPPSNVRPPPPPSSRFSSRPPPKLVTPVLACTRAADYIANTRTPVILLPRERLTFIHAPRPRPRWKTALVLIDTHSPRVSGRTKSIARFRRPYTRREARFSLWTRESLGFRAESREYLLKEGWKFSGEKFRQFSE